MAALGLNPAAALPWLVPLGRRETEKTPRKCCKKKVLGIALGKGLMRKVQSFLSKLLNFDYYEWREIFITLSLFLVISSR